MKIDHDTKGLWKFYAVTLFLRGLWMPIIIPGNFVYLLVIAGYVVIIKSLFHDGRYFKYMIPLTIVDILMAYVAQNDPSIFSTVVLIFPVIPVIIMSIIYRPLILPEVDLFDRTILSMNDVDANKARIAMETLDPVDIAEVGAYRPWDTVS